MIHFCRSRPCARIGTNESIPQTTYEVRVVNIYRTILSPIAVYVLILCATLEQPAEAGTVSVYNVKDPPYNATGLGTVSDHVAIQAAINAAELGVGSISGGTVYFPPGIYRIDVPLTIKKSGITLTGHLGGTIGSTAFGAVIDVRGLHGVIINGNTAYFCGNNVPTPTRLYSNRIDNLMFTGAMQPIGGATICAMHVNTLTISNVIVMSPSNGIRAHDFNVLNVDRTHILFPRYDYGFWLTGGGASGLAETNTDGLHRSDVADFSNVAVVGPGGVQGGTHGVIIDGAVNTVSAHKLYLLGMQGAGLLITNNINAHSNPEFATFYGLEVDHPYLDAIRIEAGQRYYFTDAQVHGSKTRHNIWIDSDVNTVSFTGGLSSGACGSGIDTFGRAVSIVGMDIISNSIGVTGTPTNPCQVPTSTWPGITLEPTSRMTVINGNKLGGLTNPVSQRWGVMIATGADQFAVVGNVAFNNWCGGISNASGLGTTKVVGNNAVTATAPPPGC